MKKLTNVTALALVLSMVEVQANSELVEKLETMKAQFEKKNASDGKPSKTQLANNSIKETIVSVLEKYETPKTIKDLQIENPVIGVDKYSNQKISALMKQLVGSGTVARVEIKRSAHFELVR